MLKATKELIDKTKEEIKFNLLQRNYPHAVDLSVLLNNLLSAYQKETELASITYIEGKEELE